MHAYSSTESVLLIRGGGYLVGVGGYLGGLEGREATGDRWGWGWVSSSLHSSLTII